MVFVLLLIIIKEYLNFVHMLMVS